MSREGGRYRAQAQARFIDEAIAGGTGIYLLGCPLLVLFHEPTRELRLPPCSGSPQPRPGVPDTPSRS